MDLKNSFICAMTSLNLPAFEYALKREGDRVYILDVLRKKYLVLTPEEWVRQHFVHYLINTHRYPKALMKIEGGLSFNRMQKRSDIVVFNREGNPWMIIECKAPDQKLRQQTLDQAAVYNHTLRAGFLVVTNGMMHICCAIDWKQGTTRVLEALPEYPVEL